MATAVASQPDKFKLYGVGKENLPTSLKTQNIKVKKDSNDPDRRLMQEGSIRGGKMKGSIQRKRSLQNADPTSALRPVLIGVVLFVIVGIGACFRSCRG